MIKYVPGFNLEDIPTHISNTILDSLPVNGGNCISVDKNSLFGRWCELSGVAFNKQWAWVVIWR